MPLSSNADSLELMAKQKKAEYDREYRKKNRERIKAKKHEYFKRTYNPEEAAIVRKGRSQQHNEYCRRPEYVKWKKEYDKINRAKKTYGEFWEVMILVIEIENLFREKVPNAYERLKLKGVIKRNMERAKVRRELRRSN